METLFPLPDVLAPPGEVCGHCEHYCEACYYNHTKYCELRRSKRPLSGLLKITWHRPACNYFKKTTP